MLALCVSVNKETLAHLEGGDIPIENEVFESVEDVCDWVKSDPTRYNAIVCDLSSSKFGIYMPRQMRRVGVSIPIIGILNPENPSTWSDQRCDFLEQGGDDLIKSPGNPREILATLRAMTRRSIGRKTDFVGVVIKNSDGEEIRFKIDIMSRICTLNSEYIPLTNQEANVLNTLAHNEGRVVSKELILQSIYRNEVDEAEIKIVDVFVCKIRKKMEAIQKGSSQILRTVWGQGYILGKLKTLDVEVPLNY